MTRTVFSFRLLLLGAVLLVCAQPALAELTISRVWPEKVYYQPGETVEVEVAVANPDQAMTSAQLRVDLIRDLDTAMRLDDRDIRLAAGQTQTWKLRGRAEPWLGIEARATLWRDDKLLAAKSEYFTCARTVHQVLLPLQFPNITGNLDGTIQQFAAHHASLYRSTYSNAGEQFAWAPSDYDRLTPAVDRWWSGQTSYNTSRTNLLALYAAAKRHGVRVITYGKAGGGGPVTFEFLRRHPGLCSYVDGRPLIENYDAAYLDFMEALGPPKPGEQRMVPGTPKEMETLGYRGAGWFQPYTPGGCNWCGVWYDSNDDEVIRHGSEELGRSAVTLGFDGVRFDGEFATARRQRLDGSWNAPAGFDADAADKGLVERMKKIIWGFKPGYLFAYNTGLNFRWNVKLDNTPQAFREKCKDEGLIAREELAFPGDVPWEDYLRVIRHDSDLTRCYGGHSALYPFHRDPRRLYCYIAAYALRSHLMYGFVGKLPLHKFATRYASFLWDDRLHGWAQAEQELAVEASRALWWKPFAAVRPAPGGGAYHVVHLINPPEGKTTYAKQAEPAGAATGVTVRWTKPVSFRRALVCDLDRFVLETVPAEKEAGAIVLRVPDVAHWSILIIESGAPTPEAVWESSREEANLKLPTPEELGLTGSSTGGNDHWRQVLQAEDFYPNERGVTDMAKELDAHGGAALHAQPGRPTWYMAVGTYIYPRVPGKYRATFRLKVKDNQGDKPVVSLGIEHYVEKPLPGIRPLSTRPTVLKASDFRQAGVYQEFQFPFQHPDIGFHGVGCVYQGGAEVWWDETRLELVEPWSAQQLEEYYAKLRPPENLKRIEDGKWNVLLVRGLWNRLYRLDDAVAKLPGPVAVSDAYTSYSIHRDTQFTGFTLDWEPLFRQNVIILANIETKGIGLGQVKMLQEWVRRGGGLVIVGGLLTLGQNWNMERGWPEMLPVELTMPFEIRPCSPAVQFGRPSPALGLDLAPNAQSVAVMYRHQVKAKPGATVLLAGKGGEPLLVGSRYGSGRVVVFTGTVLGQAEAGQTSFWQSPAWPEILAAAMRWSRRAD